MHQIQGPNYHDVVGRVRRMNGELIGVIEPPKRLSETASQAHCSTIICTTADLLNDRVVPFFEEHDVKPLRVLTSRSRTFMGEGGGCATCICFGP